MSRVKRLVDKLDLEPHPEGGYFNEMYRGDEKIRGKGEFPAGRSFGTAIYYLLKGKDISKFHRIRSDEIWHFYEGSSATIHIIHPDGLYETLYLGSDLDSGYQFQQVVSAKTWFGVSVDQPDGYLLAGCTVAPDFDFTDFEMGDAYKLKQEFPEHESIIKRLT